MVHVKNIFWALSLACLFNSCEDFLNVPPEGQLTEDIYFSDESKIEDAVAQVYSSLNWRYYRLGGMYFATHEMCADDYEVGSFADFTAFRNFEYLANNVYIERYWDQWYGYINDCNVVIDYTKERNSDRCILAEAQAKFFRAYHYFDMVRVFGEIPLHDHVPEQDEANIPKSSEDEVYKLIIDDLNYAIQHLKTHEEWGSEGNGRVSQETAKGLLSLVYLTRQDYENALKYAEEVIREGDFSLYSDYRNLYAPWNNYSCENMLPGHFSYQYIAGRERNPYVEYQGIPSNDSKLGSFCILPSREIVNAYEVGDPRKTASIFEQGETIPGYPDEINWREDYVESGKIYANKKVIWDYDANGWNYSGWPSGDFFKQELNMPFMRYAEILLIAAEAANEIGGKTGEALNYLEQVRFRARGNRNYEEANVLPEIVTTDKVELRHLIWNERRVELAFEGHRWFDLVRYEKVEPGYTTNLMRALGRVNFDYNKYSIFPLPENRVISSEGMLIQNVNWR